MARKRGQKPQMKENGSGPAEVQMGFGNDRRGGPERVPGNTPGPDLSGSSSPLDLGEEIIREDQPAHLVFFFGLDRGLQRIRMHRVPRRGGGFKRLRCHVQKPCPICDADYTARDVPMILVWNADENNWSLCVLDQEWRERLLDDLEGIDVVSEDLPGQLVTVSKSGFEFTVRHETVLKESLPGPKDLQRLGDPEEAIEGFVPLESTVRILETVPEIRDRLRAKGLLRKYLPRKR